jgi:hypothetical protein
MFADPFGVLRALAAKTFGRGFAASTFVFGLLLDSGFL